MFVHILKTNDRFSASIFESSDDASAAAQAANGKSLVMLVSTLPLTSAYLTSVRAAITSSLAVVNAVKGAPEALVSDYARRLQAPLDQNLLLMALAADGIIPASALQAPAPAPEPAPEPWTLPEPLVQFLRAHIRTAKFLPYISVAAADAQGSPTSSVDLSASYDDDEDEDEDDYADDEDDEDDEDDDDDEDYDDEDDEGVIDIENAKVWSLDTDKQTATFYIGPVEIVGQPYCALSLLTIPLQGITTPDALYEALGAAVVRELITSGQLVNPARLGFHNGETRVKLV